MESLHFEQQIKNLLRVVARQDASDLHLVVGRYPTLRSDGKLVLIGQTSMLTADDTKSLAYALMTEENKKKLLSTGQVDFSYNFEDKARFRVNAFFQKGYISVALRLIPRHIRTLEELNMPEKLLDFTKRSQGLVPVAGPVGHGKSTTLASLINHINHNESKHIITIEDPIEYMYEQDQCIINQREVGHDSKDFNGALKAIFREDADVILLGELRDLEAMSTAMTAAETGHLIFATLHTNDAAQTVDRIVDVFPAHQQNQIRSQLSSVLLGIVSQRLLPRAGGGRIPALEIMIKNHAIGNLIRENKAYQIDNVIETNAGEGMISMDKSLADLVLRGFTTMESALHYAKNSEYVKMLVES